MAFLVVRKFLPAVRAVLHQHLSAGTPGPLSAADIAGRIGLTYGHETSRRRVRELIVVLREEEGLRICASDGAPDECGYWLARDDAEWREWLEARSKRLRFGFVKARQIQETARDATTGQGKLFEDARPVRW